MPTANTYKLSGTKNDIEFSFPFEEKVAIRLTLKDKKGNELERWEKKVSMNPVQYFALKPFFPKVHEFINNLMKGQR